MKKILKVLLKSCRETPFGVGAAAVCSLILSGALFTAFAVDTTVELPVAFGDIPANTETLSGVEIEGVLAPESVFQSVPLTEEQKARGITYEKKGIQQDTAIAIGEGAKASVDPAYVETAGSNTILRSVSVAIGGHADARVDNYCNAQAIAIGWMSQAKASNAIAIGSGNQSTNETAMTGDAAYAAGDSSIAMGYGAKATALQAVQFGKGVNDTKQSFKFFDTYIVKDGKLAVEESSIDTNTVEEIVADAIAAALDPRIVHDYDDPDNELIKVQSHAITTLLPTNALFADVDVEATSTRNYELFFADTPEMRQNLPVQVFSGNTNLTKLGVWWNRKILRLPFMAKVQEPITNLVLLTVEEYPATTAARSPTITNLIWTVDTNNNTKTISQVLGTDLDTLKSFDIAWQNTVTNYTEGSSHPIGVEPYTITTGVVTYATYTLPAMPNTIPSTAEILSLKVTDYDSGGWSPTITNVVWEVDDSNTAKKISRVCGTNLQSLKSFDVAWQQTVTNIIEGIGLTAKTGLVSVTKIDHALYPFAFPEMTNAIPAAAEITSVKITDYYTDFYKEVVK